MRPKAAQISLLLALVTVPIYATEDTQAAPAGAEVLELQGEDIPEYFAVQSFLFKLARTSDHPEFLASLLAEYGISQEHPAYPALLKLLDAVREPLNRQLVDASLVGDPTAFAAHQEREMLKVAEAIGAAYGEFLGAIAEAGVNAKSFRGALEYQEKGSIKIVTTEGSARLHLLNETFGRAAAAALQVGSTTEKGNPQ